MHKTLYLLQAQLPDAAGKLVNYGPLGIYSFITLVGYASALFVLYKNFERQLKEKDKRIDDLTKELRECRQEMRDFRDGAFRRMNDTMEETLRVVQDNSAAIHENSSAVNESKGVMLSLSQIIVEGIQKLK